MTYSRRSSTSSRAKFNAGQWAAGFTQGFSSINPWHLDSVRFRKAVALNGAYIAVIYDDTFGRLTGRTFSVEQLNTLNLTERNIAEAAVGMILGEIIEPSAPGTKWDFDLVAQVNYEFPGLHWIGPFPD